jgi:hypothetical protein
MIVIKEGKPRKQHNGFNNQYLFDQIQAELHATNFETR